MDEREHILCYRFLRCSNRYALLKARKPRNAAWSGVEHSQGLAEPLPRKRH